MSNSNLYKRIPSVSAARGYLRANGWDEVGTSKKYRLFSKSDNNQKQEVIIAKSEDVRGWQKSLADVIDQLASINHYSTDQMISAILAVRYDIVRSRISDSLVRHDTIDMETAVEYVSGLKSLMISSAAAELKKSQLIRRSPQQATEYGRKCRFGHTFKGSFGFVVESPVEFDEAQKDLIDVDDGASDQTVEESPFERRVVERIAIGMASLEVATREGRTDPLVEGYVAGLNANMLDDLLNLHEAAKFSRLNFDFQWSPQLRETKVLDGFDFSLGPERIEIIEAASRELKRTEVAEREAVAGYVTDLHTDFDLRAADIFHDDRKVVVKISYQGYTQRRLHISLNEEDYAKALAAHETGKLVSVVGKMEKRGRYWHLLDPDNFQIVSS